MLEPEIEPWIDQVHCGDALELMQRMPAASVDLVVTSPPYNLRHNMGGFREKKTQGGMWAGNGLVEGYDGYEDNMEPAEYMKWQRECIQAMLRLLRPGGAIFYNHKHRIQEKVLQDRYEIVKGFPVRQNIIWDRCGGINFNKHYFVPMYEIIYLIATPEFRLKPKSWRWGDVWRMAPSRNPEHPAASPLELARRCIESTYAEVVLDPFLGSGTTAVAAHLLERHYIGLELSARYCDLARQRLSRANPIENEQSLFGNNEV